MPSDFRRVEQYIVELSTNGGPFLEVSTNTTAHHCVMRFDLYSFLQWKDGVINGDQRSFQVTNLNPGVTYRLRMQSRNIAGMSGASNIVSFQTSTSREYYPHSTMHA